MRTVDEILTGNMCDKKLDISTQIKLGEALIGYLKNFAQTHTVGTGQTFTNVQNVKVETRTWNDNSSYDIWVKMLANFADYISWNFDSEVACVLGKNIIANDFLRSVMDRAVIDLCFCRYYSKVAHVFRAKIDGK